MTLKPRFIPQRLWDKFIDLWEVAWSIAMASAVAIFVYNLQYNGTLRKIDGLHDAQVEIMRACKERAI